MQNKACYYDILGVQKYAASDEIRRAFHRQALIWHPDRHSDSNKELATSKFKDLGEAYRVLIDEQRRKIYNESGHEGLLKFEQQQQQQEERQQSRFEFSENATRHHRKKSMKNCQKADEENDDDFVFEGMFTTDFMFDSMLKFFGSGRFCDGLASEKVMDDFDEFFFGIKDQRQRRRKQIGRFSFETSEQEEMAGELPTFGFPSAYLSSVCLFPSNALSSDIEDFEIMINEALPTAANDFCNINSLSRTRNYKVIEYEDCLRDSANYYRKNKNITSKGSFLATKQPVATTTLQSSFLKGSTLSGIRKDRISLKRRFLKGFKWKWQILPKRKSKQHQS